ncbi:MAG: hypothetical protein WCT50_04620 [Patescibacteria group bacterium]|jgi:hypothetical protein
MSFGNFEHLEGVNPSDQYDRLGKKEDAEFLSNKSSEQATIEQDLTERQNSDIISGEVNAKINEVKAKIADLNEVIRTRGEEEEKLPSGFLEAKGFELKEAQAELSVLETQARESVAEQPKNRNFKEDLLRQPFQN